MKNYRPYFRKAIKHHFPARENAIITATESEFNLLYPEIAFAATSKNPMDRRIEVSGYFLALIKVLDKLGETFETIRTICLEVATDFVQPKNRFQAWLKRIPPKIVGSSLVKPIVKVFGKRVGQLGHPDGFVANIITAKKETLGLGFGVDILECGICKLYQKHNYKRFASILCEVDHITTSLAGLDMTRTGTIANGAAKCDFRYKRK